MDYNFGFDTLPCSLCYAKLPHCSIWGGITLLPVTWPKLRQPSFW